MAHGTNATGKGTPVASKSVNTGFPYAKKATSSHGKGTTSGKGKFPYKSDPNQKC